MTTHAVHYSTGKDDWQTPPELFAKLDAEFGFTLDVAATAKNAKCEHFLGGKHYPDSLAVAWHECRPWGEPPVCWMNPPYSRWLQRKFIAKASEERYRGVTTVALLPARTDTLAFHMHIYQREGVEVRFLKGRIKFVGAAHGAPFPSMVVVFRGK
jgi:phage N-6-adenine-methyltransferase